jgi:hypothetical protein
MFCGAVADDQLVHGLPNKQIIEIGLMSVVGITPTNALENMYMRTYLWHQQNKLRGRRRWEVFPHFQEKDKEEGRDNGRDTICL